MKKFNYHLIFFLIIGLLLFVSNIYFIISLIKLAGIETLIRTVIIFIIILLMICFYIKYLKVFFTKKKSYIIYSILIILYSIILIIIGMVIQNTIETLSNLTNDKTLYQISLVTKDDTSSLNSVGILSSNTPEYDLSIELANEKKIDNVKEYSDYISLINSLDEIDSIILPSNYKLRFANIDGLHIDLEKTKVITSKEKEIVNKTGKKTLSEPFTVLLMGVDSETEGIRNSVFNGDALMLITFNPNTLTTTILSIPRDSYVPIACFPGQERNKITHAAWYGENCMINTIQNFLDIKIDYYVKVNFRAVVDLVDLLGGVELDIPYSFCEQNSKREWGENTIYVEAGLQTLNGEQALAFSRNRHPNPLYCSKKWTNYESNDFIRGKHQQEVIKALLNKLKTINDLNSIYSLLDTISNNLETNMSTSEILSLYNIVKDILAKSTGNVDELISMKRLYLSGIDAYIYEKSLKMTLYDYVLYEDSIEDVSNAMKENLGLKEKVNILKFDFDSNEEYEEKVIGQGIYSKLPDYKVLPDFKGDSLYQSSITAKNLGLKVEYKYDDTIEGLPDTVVEQDYQPGTLISKIKKLTLTIKKEKVSLSDDDGKKSDDKKTSEDEKVDEENDKSDTEYKESTDEEKENNDEKDIEKIENDDKIVDADEEKENIEIFLPKED